MYTEQTIKVLQAQIEASETIIRLENNTIDAARKKIAVLKEMGEKSIIYHTEKEPKYSTFEPKSRLEFGLMPHVTNNTGEQSTSEKTIPENDQEKNPKLGFGFGESPI